jgi:hypothetical protein
MNAQLENGRYDAFVLWAEKRDDGVALECTITTGSHKGSVVDLVSNTLVVHDELALVGVPCTLVVDGDEIRVEID